MNGARGQRAGLPTIAQSYLSASWNGMRLPTGRHILLIGDQGFGDTLQFARYIPMVAERCAEVMVGCSAELLPLLRRIPGVAHADYRWTQIPPCTAYARLSSSTPFLFPDDGRPVERRVSTSGPGARRVTWRGEGYPAREKGSACAGPGAQRIPMIGGDRFLCARCCP